MSIHQHATLEDTVYFWFAANDTSGTGADGATPVFDVRLAGAAADAIPVLSGAAALLTHANYPAGAHEVAIAATDGNGFAAGETYSVFVSIDVDSQDPTGFIGSFTLGPIVANVTHINGDLTDGSPAVADRPILNLQQLNIHCDLTGEGAIDARNDNANGVGGLYKGLSADIMLFGTGTIYDIVNGQDVSVNLASVSDSSTAANNLELQYDGTGISGNTFPATQSQVTGIANVGAATNVHAIASPNGFTATDVGGETLDEDATHALDGITHDITDNGGTLDCYYIFDLEGIAAPVSVTMTGRLVNASNSLQVHVNTGTVASPVWEQRDTLAGQASPTLFPHTFTLFTDDIMTGADAGKVALRFYNTGLSSATLYVDQIFCSKSADVSITGYANGSIWINTTGGGTAGQVVNVNGTADNPSDNLTDALAISVATNLGKFEISALSTVDLIADATGMVGLGENWDLGFEGQVVTGATAIGANVTGVADSSSTGLNLIDCHVGTASLGPVTMHRGTIDSTLTFLAAGDYRFVRVASGVAGAGAPTVDLGAGTSAINAEFRWWSGGLTLLNVNTNRVVSVDAVTGGSLTLTLAGGVVEARGAGMKALVVNGSSGTVNVAGFYGTITDNSGGDVTITQTWYHRTVVQSEVNDALVAIHLDHLLAVNYDPASKPGVATALFNELIVSDAGVSQYSTNALERAPGGTTSVAISVSPIAGSLAARFTSPLITLIQLEHINYGPWIITDSDDEPVDLSGLDLSFVVYDFEGTATELWRLTSLASEIVLSGDDNNQITLVDDDTNTQDAGRHGYTLWDDTNGRPLQRGVVSIERSSGPVEQV